MVNDKKKYRFLIGFVIVIVYFFVAARPIPVETVLTPQWLTSLESGYPLYFEDGNGVSGRNAPEPAADGGQLFPFTLGDRFGYFNRNGGFALNQKARGNVSVSENYWAEYAAIPQNVEIRDPLNEILAEVAEPQGYPLFIDNRFFLISEEQNSLTALDNEGNPLWTYDFAAPLTGIDAAAGLILAGSLDGTVELLDQSGSRVFSSEIAGSRYSAIYGCRISQDGLRLAIISGFDDQRFLLLERFGDSYKVAYHEFLADGFRRPVYISFIDHDRWVAFESEGCLALYNIGARNSIKLPLEGNVVALDSSGMDDRLFAVTSQSERKKQLVEIRLPRDVIMQAPFSSENVFLSRQGEHLYVGGGSTIASFALSRK
ncbi:MAG: PQQ-like beta-propeller repeat protein [Treponema sp.]|nr:PQQ-like beta-propeller repeat protein [Treponema sp.]